MSASLIRRTGLALLLACGTALPIAASAQAQEVAEAYEPTEYQPGKDVVWVPTPDTLVATMLDMAKVTPADFVMDLGSGDGRTVIAAAKRGARALGVEYNPEMVELSNINAAKAGVSAKAKFVKADLFETDFSQATVITMFLLPTINVKLRPKILALKPGTRIVSNTFDMAEWKPDEVTALSRDGNCYPSWCTALLWIVPARAEGTHRTAHGEVTLVQTFQMLTGTLSTGGKTVALEGRVRGEEVAFSAGGREYRGRMNGANLELR